MTILFSFLLPLIFGLFGIALSAEEELDWGDSDEESGELEEDRRREEGPVHELGAVEDANPPEDETAEEKEDSLATVAEARSLCDDAMGALHEGDADRAFDRLETHWAFSPDEMTELQAELGRTRAVVAERYGDALDYRLVREDTVGDVLARFVYLERFERHGLRWRFTFYEGGSGWGLNDVYFDDEIEALFDG